MRSKGIIQHSWKFCELMGVPAVPQQCRALNKSALFSLLWRNLKSWKAKMAIRKQTSNHLGQLSCKVIMLRTNPGWRPTAI